MTDARPDSWILYAAVRSDEARRVRASLRSLTVVVEGGTAAVTGAAPPEADVFARAMAHDRVIGRLLGCCSSLVPFRLGVAAPPTDDLRALLRDNAAEFERQLDRVRDCVEVGLKIRAKNEAEGAARFDLAPVRALVPLRCDRQERITALSDGLLFEGVYLLARAAIDDFWAALDRMRSQTPERAILGVGPFAPYSFCDLHIEHPRTSERSE